MREHARALLGGYRGILQCDGYAGYKGLADAATGPGPAVVAFCWSHARRQFDDLAQKAKAPIAEEALRRLIEAEIRGASPELSTRRGCSPPTNGRWSVLNRCDAGVCISHRPA